ncbi:RHS repeat-associated core domain-containing protein [Polaribacter cellanae]
MNGRMYDAKLGRFLSPDNYIQEPFSTQSFNRYGYVWNNPLKFTDITGEWFGIDDLVAGIIGGVINLVSNAIQGNIHSWGDGLAAFGAGAAAGTLSLYGPAGWAAGGAIVGGTNAWLGGAKGWDILKSAGVGAISGLAGGVAGQWAAEGLGNVVINGLNIASPVVKGIVGGAIGGAAGGYVGGFAGGYLMTGNLSLANKAGLSGLAMGASIGGVAGGVGAYKWAIDNKIDPWSGQKINGHHSFPKFMGGDSNQKLTNIGEESHKQLHRDMNNFLKNQTDGFGNHMRPQRGNSGKIIQRNFDTQIRVNKLKTFYNQNWYKYPRSTFDFYKNTNQFNLQWKIFRK